MKHLLLISAALLQIITLSGQTLFLKTGPYFSTLNRFIFGLNAGSGIDFHFGKLIVGAVFDYCFSFNKLVEHKSEWGVTNTIRPKAFAVNAKAGYKL